MARVSSKWKHINVLALVQKMIESSTPSIEIASFRNKLDDGQPDSQTQRQAGCYLIQTKRSKCQCELELVPRRCVLKCRLLKCLLTRNPFVHLPCEINIRICSLMCNSRNRLCRITKRDVVFLYPR